jgi:hexosaminidase
MLSKLIPVRKFNLKKIKYMKKFFLFILGIISCLIFSSCNNTEKDIEISIVPKPQSISISKGNFNLNNNTKIYFDGENSEVDLVINHLISYIKPATGFELSKSENIADKNIITLKLNPDELKNAESYSLNVDKNKIEIESPTPKGLFYGVQTLLQLFPAEIFSPGKKDNIAWVAPCVSINDEPMFSYRGAHLDVCRHFFALDSIKRYIDHLARYKVNNFHWHLSDDQGWRIEIKKYPKLLEIGSCREETLIGSYADDVPHRYDGIKYCGYYTQEQAREIVKYAAERFINIIPEIELPGHALAALSAYPELSCDPSKTYEAATTWGVFEDVFCPNETTFTFFEDVFTEIMEIFPSKYIHIGGDECPKKAWKESKYCQNLIKEHNLKDEHGLQSYFIQRIEKFINSHDRKIIGWDEILEGGLAPNATVMSWQGIEGGIEAATKGHDVIMTPTSYCYFDYYQADPAGEPVSIGGFVTINKVYHFNPIPEEIPENKRHHIIGAQSNIWTEYIKSFKHVEYMLFPRLLALSEVNWTKPENKNWDDFCVRLPHQLNILENLGVDYGTISYNIKFNSTTNDKNQHVIALSSEVANAQIVYTTDGSDPDINSQKYTKPIMITGATTLKVAPILPSKKIGNIQKKEIICHKALNKKVSYEKFADSKYIGGGKFGLVDGMKGSKNFGDGFWQGFFGNDCNVTIDLDVPQSISKISIGTTQSSTSWVIFPEYVSFYASNDNKNWDLLGKIDNDVDPMENGRLLKDFSVNVNSDKQYQYLQVNVTSLKMCPVGHIAEGNPCWIFVDEIVVE